jgi:hypothetical protein
MINIAPEIKLDGIAQQLPNLSNQLAKIYDKAMDLEIKADWYDELDSQWGGPPTQSELRKTADDLRKIYMSIASITGLDPCWQFEETKQMRLLRWMKTRT